MRRIILAVALLALSAQGAGAADAEGRFAAKGVGLASCSRFTQEFESRSEHADQFVGWMMGYLTAYNQFTPETFDIVSWEDAVILGPTLSENCKRYPDLPFARAVILMTEALRADRLVTADRPVEATAGDLKVRIYTGTLKRVQEKLAELDLYKGTPDGKFGDTTRFAISEFQQQRGINVTGVPDQKTLMLLLRSGTP